MNSIKYKGKREKGYDYPYYFSEDWDFVLWRCFIIKTLDADFRVPSSVN